MINLAISFVTAILTLGLLLPLHAQGAGTDTLPGLAGPEVETKREKEAETETEAGSKAEAEVEAKEETETESSETTANNPLSLVPAVQVQNYYQPVLNGDGKAGSNQPYLRAILPFNGFGGRNLMRISLPAGTMVWDQRGTEAGLGDLTIFSVRVFRLSRTSGFGVGPLLVAPTATKASLGLKDWQVGAQGTFSSHYPWGLLAGLVGYQQSLGGRTNVLTVQPFIFRNIGQGFYLRSSAISTLDTSNGTGVLPMGLGLGKVTHLRSGQLLNVYVEPQYSLAVNGDSQPRFQVFAGFNLQFLPR